MAGKTALELLASIDAGIQQLIRLATPVKPVHVDLDGQWGDPVIKAKDPRDWSGPSMIGRTFSACPPEYLDLLAQRYDYFAEKSDAAGEMTDKGKPKGDYSRLDAARARGWAARIRSGEHVQAPAATAVDTDPKWATDDGAQDEIPF